MMQTFRNNMKIIFYVLIFFFVGWMAVTLTGLDDYLTQQSQEEMRGMKYAGEVDGNQINRSTYETRVQNTVNMASSQRASGNLSAWEIDQIADQVWSEILNEIILGKAFDRRSIEVYDSEIIEYIRSNPVQELRESPQLQTDGRFDYDKYLNLLSNPAAANLVLELEREARQKIPNLKLFLEIGSLGKLTDAELERAFIATQERVSVAYIEFEPDSLVSDSEVSVSEDDIAAYYEEHMDEFQRPETADIEYILLPLIPSLEDTLATLDTLKSLSGRLEDGEPWDSLAMLYSDGELRTSGGDLGWFARDDFQDTEMVDIAFNLKPGETSDPTLTTSGYQLVRTDSVRTSDGTREVKAHRILIRVRPGRKTLRDVRSRTRNLRKLMGAEGASFSGVAADSGFVVQQTGDFAIGGQIPGLQLTREMLDFLYSAKEEQLSYPITVLPQGQQASEMVLLAKVISRKDEGQISLAETSDGIRRHLMLEAKKELARSRIEPLIEGYDNYDNLTAFAVDKGLAVDTSGMFTRASGLRGAGRNNEFIGTAFGLPVGVKSPLIETEYYYYLLEPLEREEPDMEELGQNREQLIQQLVGTRMQTVFSLFSSELMDNTEVKDYRNLTPQQDTTAGQ